MTDERTDLIGLSRAELAAERAAIGEKQLRARQLWHWIYGQGVTDFAHMTTLSKGLRDRLGRSYVVGRPAIARQQASDDGSRKWLVRFADGNEAEAVFIPDDGRGALCMSSQIGCTLTCKFCHTGTQRLVRDLTAGEIVGQMMVARDSYDEWPSTKQDRLVSNVVMMGMGEPLFNYDNVAKSLKILMDPDGIATHLKPAMAAAFIVVPATADLIARLALGLAGDAVSLGALSAPELRFFCPSMNDRMWNNPLVQANVQRLEGAGWQRIGPDFGQLAEGYEGDGRMSEPERILEVVVAALG